MTTIPPFLREMFQGTSLASVKSTLVAIGPTGIILWVNAAWREFAAANGGEDVLARFAPGASYYDGISPPLRGFYESVFTNALATGEPYEQEYECSSADTFRSFQMRVLPFGADGLLLDHGIVVEHAREEETAEAIEATYRDQHGFIRQCSNCRRVHRADRTAWDWVRVWVARPPEETSHGICKTCIVFYWGTRRRPG